MEKCRLVTGFLPRLHQDCLKRNAAAKWSVCVFREGGGTARLYGFATDMADCGGDHDDAECDDFRVVSFRQLLPRKSRAPCSDCVVRVTMRHVAGGPPEVGKEA